MRPLALLALAALAACSPPPPEPLPPEAAAERDSVLALLRSADRAPLAAAFDRLDAVGYRVTTRTEQLDAAGRPVAVRETEAAVAPGGARTVLRADSSGAFDLGAFARFAGGDEAGAPENPIPLVLPEEPAYLDPRGRETFAFAFAPDTALGGQRVRVLTVAARPGVGDDQPLRRARLYLDPATNGLVGVRWRQATDSFLFGEESDLAVMLRPGPGGWLPHTARFETAVKAPLSDARRFRLTRTYAAD